MSQRKAAQAEPLPQAYQAISQEQQTNSSRFTLEDIDFHLKQGRVLLGVALGNLALSGVDLISKINSGETYFSPLAEIFAFGGSLAYIKYGSYHEARRLRRAEKLANRQSRIGGGALLKLAHASSIVEDTEHN